VSRVPPHASGSPEQPRADELEELEELGDDAIIAQQQGAHAPAPRAQVTEEARSIVISEHPPAGAKSPSTSDAKRSRAEKTVVIRDRRQLDELRREMAKRKPPSELEPRSKPATSRGVALWVIVGLAAFLAGGVVAVLATGEDEPAAPAAPAVVSQQPVAPAAPVETSEPPSVSIDELPIEGSKRK
jgi:hypothetical protein